MQFDPYFKQIFKTKFDELGVEARTGVKVGTLPLEIDLLFINKKNKDLSVIMGPFASYCRLFDIVEFKSAVDRCPLKILHKLRAYMAYFWEAEELSLLADYNTSGWLITGKKPKWITKELEAETLQEIYKGFYCLERSAPVYIVVINDLPIEPQYYPFLLFSTGSKLEEFLRKVFSENQQLYKGISYILYNQKVMRMAEASEIELEDVSANVKAAILSLGLKNVLEDIGIEEVIQAIGIEEAVQVIGLKKVIDTVGLKEVIDTVGLKEISEIVDLKDLVEELTDQQRRELRKLLDE